MLPPQTQVGSALNAAPNDRDFSMWFSVGVDAFNDPIRAPYIPVDTNDDYMSNYGVTDARTQCLMQLVSSVEAACEAAEATHPALRCGLIVEVSSAGEGWSATPYSGTTIGPLPVPCRQPWREAWNGACAAASKRRLPRRRTRTPHERCRTALHALSPLPYPTFARCPPTPR